jgi:Tfp pilus assembly protein PilX
MARVLRTAAGRARDERGSFLVEVMATCLLLGIVTMGTLQLMDRAQAQSGVQRARAIAADLAQGRLDELRGLRYEQLRVLPPTATVTKAIDGVPYTLTPTVTQRPATDSSGACSTERGRDVLQVTVIASSPALGTARPVRVDTLVAAPVGVAGSVRVTVTDARGAPVDRVTVRASGRSAVTEAGCAQLFLPPGAHTLETSLLGLVTPAATGGYSDPVTVNAERTTSVAYELDRPGSATLRFRSRPTTNSSTPPAEVFEAEPGTVSYMHSRLNVPHRLAAPVLTTASPTMTQSGLYPFTSAYAVWAGACDAAKPPTPAQVTVPQGGASPVVTVDLWALNVEIKNGTQNLPTDIKLRIANPSCDPSRVWTRTAVVPMPGTPGTKTGSIGGAGGNAFPYGTGYTVCASSDSLRKAVQITGVDNTGTWPQNATRRTLDFATVATGTTCPA